MMHVHHTIAPANRITRAVTTSCGRAIRPWYRSPNSVPTYSEKPARHTSAPVSLKSLFPLVHFSRPSTAKESEREQRSDDQLQMSLNKLPDHSPLLALLCVPAAPFGSPGAAIYTAGWRAPILRHTSVT